MIVAKTYNNFAGIFKNTIVLQKCLLIHFANIHDKHVSLLSFYAQFLFLFYLISLCILLVFLIAVSFS